MINVCFRLGDQKKNIIFCYFFVFVKNFILFCIQESKSMQFRLFLMFKPI
jgi:hypothetical protein